MFAELKDSINKGSGDLIADLTISRAIHHVLSTSLGNKVGLNQELPGKPPFISEIIVGQTYRKAKTIDGQVCIDVLPCNYRHIIPINRESEYYLGCIVILSLIVVGQIRQLSFCRKVPCQACLRWSATSLGDFGQCGSSIAVVTVAGVGNVVRKSCSLIVFIDGNFLELFEEQQQRVWEIFEELFLEILTIYFILEDQSNLCEGMTEGHVRNIVHRRYHPHS